MNIFGYITKFPNPVLLLILIISFGIRVYNLNYNSPFLDEAIYLELGRQVFSGEWKQEDPYSWVGGNPLFYPTLSAIFGIFGIVGSRFLNVILGTLSVFLIYYFTKNLKLSETRKINEIIGLISAAFLSVLSMPIFLSRFAIYDMLSFTLFLLGLCLLQNVLTLKKPNLWQRESRFFLAAVVFFLSFLAKYITLILFPIILIWIFIKSRQLNKNVSYVSLGYFAAPLLIATGWYVFQNFNDLRHFQQEQITNVAYGYERIFLRFANYSLPVLPFASLGTLILLFQKKIITTLFLFIGALIVPIVHIVTNNYASVHQHVFLSLIFLLPLVAYLFTWIIEKRLGAGVILIITVLAVVFIYSQDQVRDLETAWPNTYKIMAYLRANTTSHERLLSSEGDVAAVSLTNLKNENIISYNYFEYKKSLNEQAYALAIRDGYFNYILFNEEESGELSKSIKASFTNHYASIYNSHPFIVYKLR